MDIKDRSAKVWGASPAGWTHAPGLEVGTQAFFTQALRRRSEWEIPWLYEVIPFASARSKKVLELGCGAGFDAYTFCSHGADYTGIDITPENIGRVQRHLAPFGFDFHVQWGDAENLEFADESFDIVFSNGVLHHTPDMARSFRAAWRVLKPGGEFWVILYHKHSIVYWLTLGLFDHILRGGFLRRSFRDRLAMIEYSTAEELPLVNVYSCADVRRILGATGFQATSMCVRKLVWEDLPRVPLVHRLYRHIPQRWLDRIGERFGWYVVALARKAKIG